MKLLFCSYCGDVVKLQRETPRYCDCGKCWGHYERDGAHATVSEHAQVIGIDNHTLRRAIDAQGLSHPDSGYRTLAAWVMGKDAPRVKWSR